MAEVNDDKIKPLVDKISSLFPLQEDARWFEAQQGRFWVNGKIMANKNRRKAFEYHDKDPYNCSDMAEIGWCESGAHAYDMFHEFLRACGL